MKLFNVAVVGASGVVGEAIVESLAELDFPVGDLFLLASDKSLGKSIKFKNKSIPIDILNDFDFSKVDFAFFSAGASVSAEYVPKAAASGAIVIDNTSHFRYDEDVPLVIPEVNAAALADFKKRNIIANPNCSTIQMLVALKPIYDAVGITRINVATYQSVSGSGRQAISELVRQTASLLSGSPVNNPEVYAKQIAFNAIPMIDELQDNGYTREEMKMVWETKKIFSDQNIKVNPTAVRVPTFYGHSEAINVETKEKLSAQEARKLLAASPGIVLIDEPKHHKYPTATEITGKHEVYVGRIREDISSELGLNLWVVADNIRKGAATNSVQIAISIINDYLL